VSIRVRTWSPPVIADLDALLTALYVEMTDRIIPSLRLGRRGPGKPPEATNAGLVWLAVAQVLLRLRRRAALATPHPSASDTCSPAAAARRGISAETLPGHDVAAPK
jgi:hypothetical protein